MRNLSKGVEVGGGGIVPPHWSDDEGDLPPAKRARDNGYASDHTAVTDYDDMWSHHVPDPRNVILTPPSMVSFSRTYINLNSYISSCKIIFYYTYAVFFYSIILFYLIGVPVG